MRYHVVAVGRVRSVALRAACDDYLARLRRYTKVAEREVRDDGRIVAALPPAGRCIALSRQGHGWSSERLAAWTERWERDGRDVAFAIGGADGLPGNVIEAADQVWSLSRLTLPHELARVVLVEQLYRAYTIRRGEPYHRRS